MPHTERLIPKTKNPPAKVKDPGVIRLVMEGRGVYNAKSDELLLLPEGAALFRDVSEGLKQQFFLRAGAQAVDCLGSDAAIRSIAERFIREYGGAALSFQEERGRRLHLTGWSATQEDAREKVNRLKEGLLPVMADRGIPPCFMESLSPCGSLYTIGGVQTESAVFDGVEGFACPQCGFGAFADSPAPFKGVQPGEGEELQPLKDIETPGANTIADLCRQLDITPDRTLKAMLYISEHLDTTTGPQDVATYVHMNPCYFSYYFKKQLGVPCSKYIAIKRLSSAAELLKSTDLSISDIVFKCGFRSVSNFYQLFSSLYTISPGKFRKLHQ